jgi:hypothetical protein
MMERGDAHQIHDFPYYGGPHAIQGIMLALGEPLGQAYPQK